MPNMTTLLEAAVGNAVLRGSTYTGTRLYAALFTAAPTDAAGTGTEANYTGYARASFRSNVQTDSQQFTAPTGSPSVMSNQNDVVFPANAGGSTQVVTHWVIFDASTGGNALFWGPLAASKNIDPSDVPSFPIGTFSCTWN